MVEFGLKLEDNKVAEWGDKYIRYERLKILLEKCAKAMEHYNRLYARNPDLAALAEENYRKGVPFSVTPKGSQDNLLSFSFLGGSGSDSMHIHTIQETPRDTSPTDEHSETFSRRDATSPTDDDSVKSSPSLDEQYYEYTSLTSSSGRGYGSSNDESGSKLLSMFEKASSGVSEFFDKKYMRHLQKGLKSIDTYALEFEQCLLEDIQIVNSFYEERLEELQVRLRLLNESVVISFSGQKQQQPPPPPPSDATTITTTRSSLSVCMEGDSSTHNYKNSCSNDDINESSRSSSSENSGKSTSFGSNSFSAFVETPLIANNTRRKRSTARQSLARALQSVSTSLHIKNIQGAEGEKQQRSLLPSSDDDDGDDDKNEDARLVREADSIKRSLADLYRCAKLLHNYSIMNYTGFVKIVKKHDKTCKEQKGRFKNAILPSKICNEGKAVEALAEHMERVFAIWFCDRNLMEARAQLLPKRGDGLEMDWSQLRLGYRMGMCAILALWVCWDCIWGEISKGTSTIGGRTAFPVFRACGGLLMLQWFWGCSVWVWTRYRVNYIYLFDFSPKTVSSALSIFNEAVDNSLVFLVNMLLYYKAGAHDLPELFRAGIFPFLLVVYTFFQLIYPRRSRRPMWHAIRLVVTAPMNSPAFFHGYIGDIFTSMVKVFQDIAWTCGFLISGDFLIDENLDSSIKHQWAKSLWYSKILIPALTLLPLWFRFNQCLRRFADTGDRIPHVANAFKYAMSMTVTLFGAFHPLYLQHSGPSNIFQIFWMSTFVSSSLYSFFWDVYMDWGLGRPRFQFLGPRLMYPRRSTYYMIIAVDLVLRFAWVLTLVPPNSGAKFALPQYLTAVSMIMELFRRTIWGFLRLENEHRSNTSGYGRRVDFVPLHFSTEGGKRPYDKQEKEHLGGSVLVEVAVVTVVVLAAAVASVVAAQHETERLMGGHRGLGSEL